MDKSAVVDVIERFRKGLETRGIRPQRVILYGSYAAGSATKESDIDVVVISGDFSGKGRWARNEIVGDVIYELFAPLEVVALTPDEWDSGESFVVDFARNGEVLYAA